jgi:hypothetical protein
MTFLQRAVTHSCSRKVIQNLKARRANRVLRQIQASIVVLALLLLASPWQSFAATPDLQTVLNASHDRIQKLDYRSSGRITKIDGSGKRTNYKFVGKAHWFSDGLRLLCEVTGPGSEKTTIVLHLTATGHVTIDAILPGAKAATPLPFEHWNDGLVGTDFSFEDMVENQYFWKGQELLPPQKYGTRDCFVLKSKSDAGDHTYYDSVTSWIDRNTFFPVHVVKTQRGSGQQKEFIYYGLRQEGGAWSATQVEAKLTGKPGSSILLIEGGSPHANLSSKDFDIGGSSSQGAAK